MKTFGIIMAGGGGTRFWPLSRNAVPKQLLNLTGKEIMVNEASDRLFTVCEKENVFVITNKVQAPAMKKVTEGRLLENQILVEPCARNTAACIGYAAFEILKKFGDGIMVITPSDAYIKNESEFTRVLQKAVSAADEKNALVTVGITPTFAATGYGYIKYDKADSGDAKKVFEFKEKPDAETAHSYVKSGTYVWNSGMFIWKASVILENFKKLLPDVYAGLEKFSEAIGTLDEQKMLEKIYPELQSISIDYGIMEKAENVLVVPGDFGWNDVGSFDTLGAIHSADKNGNVLIGDTLALDSKDCVLYSNGRLVSAVGLENIVVVETKDAVLVCDKNKVQDVKKIVEELKARSREELL